MESVSSMDESDRSTMSAGFGCEPVKCDAGHFTWCHRPRLYWLSWDLAPDQPSYVQEGGDKEPDELFLYGEQDCSTVLRPGWHKCEPSKSFPTFTTARPQARPGRKPAGIKQCSSSELERWAADLHRFPPYQYRDEHCVSNRQGQLRIPDAEEREMMMGFPLHYTSSCVPKSERKGVLFNDTRLSLLGNSWSVPVVAWLLGQLLGRLGFIRTPSPQDILDALQPGQASTAQGRLVRLPFSVQSGNGSVPPYDLAFKLGNLVSIKGDDVLVSAPSSQMVRHHRLRASIPSKLWRWSVIAGWKWTQGTEHINSLELRAILTTIRWRVEHRLHTNTRMIHLTDSLVCLHGLTRGRSSSRKLRRTLSRINAMILASNIQPLWGYVHTDQNPADKPSRWGRRVRTKFKKNVA